MCVWLRVCVRMKQIRDDDDVTDDVDKMLAECEIRMYIHLYCLLLQQMVMGTMCFVLSRFVFVPILSDFDGLSPLQNPTMQSF